MLVVLKYINPKKETLNMKKKLGNGLSSGPRTRKPAEESMASMHKLFVAIDAIPASHPRGKLILFSSAHPGEGKSVVIAEFAELISNRADRALAVVDAGFRHDLTRLCSNVSAVDFSTWFFPGGNKRKIPTESIPTAKTILMTVATETLSANSEFLSIERTKLLAESFDYVLIDMPAVSSWPYVVSNARNVDAVIIVVEAQKTRWPIVQQLREQFDLVGAKVIGIFLNKRVYFIPKKIYEWF